MAKKMALIFLFLFVALPTVTEATNNFSFSRESIMTVCDIYRVTITSKGQEVPECEELPSGKDFFANVTSKSEWEMPCEDQSNDEPLTRKPTIWDRTIRNLHWVLETVQTRIAEFGGMASRAIQDVSRVSRITKQWEGYWYFVASLVVALMFFIQGLYLSRPGTLYYNIILNLIIGFGATALFYMVHLYFKNFFVMASFILIFLFTLCPWYPHLKLSGLGVVTFMELLIPLFGALIKFLFDTNLYFGPILSLYINCGGIIIHILCLLALYVDEKLILVKVFFLPFYRMVQRIFRIGMKNEEEIRFMKEGAQMMNRELFSTFGVAPPAELSTAQRLNEAFTSALSQACKFRQTDWQDQCWYFIRDKCREQTWNMGPITTMIGWILCPRLAYESCDGGRIINLDEYCKAPGMTAFGAAFKGYQDAIDQLRNEIIIDPLKPVAVNSEILEAAEDLGVFANKWTWWVRMIISFGLSALVVYLLAKAVFKAVLFLFRYRIDPHFCNNYLSRSMISQRWGISLSRREQLRYYSSFIGLMYDWITTMMNHPSHFAKYTSLVIKVMVCFWVEQSARFLSWHLNNIQFVVPEYGEARFVFNVQGDGIIARIMRAFLGSFSLQSKYCKVADSSVCNTVFIPVEWQMWFMLFLLAIFYFLIGIYKSKSDYIMCRICDFLMPKKGESRAEVVLEEVLEERRKRGVIVEALAKEEIEDPVFLREQNGLILKFFQPRQWYHRFMPTIVLSTIAYFKFGIDSIMCQICALKMVEGRFRCNALFMCDDCRFCLTECPCGSELCRDGNKFEV